ncbi:MAG: site-specific integrase [Lachnospiraceae bacterium]|nr:site-specific integrase [Lachnospiraceae bacterium]MCM1231178.1 site-specific integrase [Ruminococcus flavefaciens]
MPRKGENIYKRRDGRWEGRYKAGYNESGKAIYRSVYSRSYSSVKEKLLMLKKVPDVYRDSGKLTVKDLFEEWLSAVRLRVKESTYANYRMKADKHILSAFGGLRYERLTVQMIHSFIENKLKSGLSAKYVSDIVIVFKSMAKYIAKVHGFRNILADVILPKSTKTEMKLLSDNQQKKLCRYLLKNIDNTSVCVLLSLYTGLRIGEICGLKWGDIDFEKSILTVRRTVQRIRTADGTEIHVGTPKSRSSQRSVPVPAFIMNILRDFRDDGNYSILSGSAKITEPRTLQRRFRSLLKKAGLPSINYHGLRHIFATNCVRLGFDVKTLSEILGHASVETTLNRYVHSSMERKVQCMNLLKIAV